MKLFDYECFTTFWSDFTIAEKCGGIPAIKDTYKRAFGEWKNDYKYLTELVMVLNYKIWWWDEKNDAISQVYNDLWMKASVYAETHLKGDELDYYLIITG